MVPTRITRKEAQAKGLKRFFVGKPCPQGHVVERFVSSSGCVVCSRSRTAEWDKANSDHKNDKRRERYELNSEKVLERNRDWYKNNKHKVLEQKQSYYVENRPDFYFRSQLRRTRKMRATPAWVDLEAINKIYQEAYAKSVFDNLKYHVDHIVPLQHPLVCGLHVPWNLRIVPAEENLSKGNKLIPELVYD